MDGSDRMIKAFLRFLLDDLRELTEETDEAKRAEKASRILANLQKILED